MEDGQLTRFGQLKLAPSFTLRMPRRYDEAGFLAMARAGMAVNAEPFHGHEPGELLLNSIRRHADGSVSATLTPLPQRADAHIRREKFGDLFSGSSSS